MAAVKANQRRSRIRIFIVLIALLVLACGTISVAADSSRSKGAEAEGRDPVAPVSSSAQPTTDAASPEPTRDAASPEPSADSGPPDPTADAGSPAPTKESDSAEPTADASSSSSDAMPVGDLPGWTQVFAEDFTEGDVPLGGFPGPIYGTRWSANYKDGTPDTAAQNQPKGQRTSGYYPSKVLSVHDGVLDMFLHTENGIAMGAAPSPVVGGATQRPYNSLVYGRISVRFKADALPGFKLAWLLWPDSKQWPQDGEIDFPEGDLSTVIYAAVHGLDASGTHVTEVRRPNVAFTSWHIATTEWSPGKIEFFLDGTSIGVVTSPVPDKPMHYILQTESCSTGCPAPETSGHVYVDWAAIWTKK